MLFKPLYACQAKHKEDRFHSKLYRCTKLCKSWILLKIKEKPREEPAKEKPNASGKRKAATTQATNATSRRDL